ncbi:MAG: DUF1761 domain-containing protein [Saprospiraceae bacterium]
MFNNINWLAVIACGFINMLLGMAWYGAFAQPWMDGNGLSMDSINATANPALAYSVSFLSAFVSGYLISRIFNRMGVTTFQDGLVSGAAIGLFALLGNIVMNLYAQRPLSLSLIDGGFAFLLYSLYGGLIGAWRKKA